MKGGEFCDWLNTYQQLKSLFGNEALWVFMWHLGYEVIP
jgi:hypothetical protein